MISFKNISITAFAVVVTVLGAGAEGLSAPLSKFFGVDIDVMMSLAFMFFGVGIGMLFVMLFGRKSKIIFDSRRHLQKKDVRNVILLIVLLFLANTLIFIGMNMETSGKTSILRNISTVSTIVFAAFLLHEKVTRRLCIGAGLIVLGSIALSVTNLVLLSFSLGNLIMIGGNLALGASFIITTLLAERNPVESAVCYGFGVGTLGLITALCLGEQLPSFHSIIILMAVGFVTSGLSTVLLQYGQRYLGAAKAGAIFGGAPLLGVAFAIPILGEIPSPEFLAALILFLPGMYFVIPRNSAASLDRPSDPSDKEDTVFFASVSERKKSGMRNYTTCFGLLLIALFFALIMLGTFDFGFADAALLSSELTGACLILGILVLLCGIVQLVLGKRVLAAVTFILMSSQIFATAVFGDVPFLNIISGIFSFLFACILLTSANPQKYAFALVNILLGVTSVSCVFDTTVRGCIMAAAVVFLLWLSIVCGTGKLRFSISKPLIEDNDLTFGRCGTVIGFLILSKIMIMTIFFEINSELFITIAEEVYTYVMLTVGLAILVGLLLMFVGKRQMAAIFFIGAGFALYLDMVSEGPFAYLSVLLSLVLGVLVVLRKRPLILPSLVCIGGAFSSMLYIQLEAFPEVLSVTFLLNAAVVLVEVYLSFAVFAEKPKLPLF